MSEILIVDPNKVYARMIKGILVEQLKDPEVDIAVNVHELRRRLKITKYDIILADLSISMDGDEMEAELKGVGKESTVVVWSILDRNERHVRKPTTRFELRATINAVLEETQENSKLALGLALEETQLMAKP